MTVTSEPHANIQTVQQLCLHTGTEEFLTSRSNILQRDARMMHADLCSAHSQGAKSRGQTLSEYR